MSVKNAIVITGASSGIGKATALTLDQMGFHVFAGVRKQNDFETLQKEGSQSLEPIFMDVTDRQTIQEAVSYIETKVHNEGIMGLVNNAGIVIAGPLEHIPVSAFQHQMDVNVTGPLIVTQAMLPLLRKAEKGRARIVNIGSIAGRTTSPFTGPYNASKHALKAITETLRMELLPWDIKVSSIEPGAVKTPIWDKTLALSDEIDQVMSKSAQKNYNTTINKVKHYARRAGENGTPVDKVVQAIVHALTTTQPKTRYKIGFDSRVRLLLEQFPDRLKEFIIRQVLSRMKEEVRKS